MYCRKERRPARQRKNGSEKKPTKLNGSSRKSGSVWKRWRGRRRNERRRLGGEERKRRQSWRLNRRRGLTRHRYVSIIRKLSLEALVDRC